MNALVKNLSFQLIRNQRQFLLHCSRFATDAKAIEDLTKKNKVVVFMKGNPEAPKCGFSNAVVQIMRMHGVQYDAHDVLLDDDIRQGVKDLTSWPTIPQVFINGEFIGGCDILLQMHQNGELIEVLEKTAGIKSALTDAAPKDEKN
ncbi:CLUMA_CG005539, isoform A [Clunio marinus]|uniref:Glutaredoxin-related protein 5, mitochondrial n=1 Tax=Clunio marinus TaxID=568069 RepID=A0A1J1HV05_9DIPT|nr:CLUMA_CG005539, isoform A [Clunio marinus]